MKKSNDSLSSLTFSFAFDNFNALLILVKGDSIKCLNPRSYLLGIAYEMNCSVDFLFINFNCNIGVECSFLESSYGRFILTRSTEHGSILNHTSTYRSCVRMIKYIVFNGKVEIYSTREFSSVLRAACSVLRAPCCVQV